MSEVADKVAHAGTQVSEEAGMAIRDEDDFNALEAEWYDRLAGRSLVMEADIDPSLAIEALQVLGANLTSARGNSRARLFRRYPAILAAGLCAIASNHYDAGTFWPNAPQGFRVDMNRQAETGKAFQAALKRMELSRFTTPHRYVGEILMHAGTPISSVGDLVRTITRWDDGRTSGDAAGFIRWASSMSQRVAVTRGFDVPTYRFLTEGGEIAEDFIERVLAAIDSGGASADLPLAIAEVIGKAINGIADRVSRKRRQAVDSVPSLIYDQHRGVQIRLPPLEAEVEAAITWTVLAGGEAQRILADAPWPGDPVEPKWAGVRTPQQAVAIAVVPGNQHWELPLVDAKDPLLVFDAKTGALIPERVSLPKGIVWLAFPADGREQPESLLEIAGELIVTERGATPHGWPGWTFIAVDAAKLEKLRLASIADRWRYVTTVDRPRFTEITEPLPYLATVDGDPILSTRPRLLLPGPRGGVGEIEWSVSIVDIGGSELSRSMHRVSSARDVDIFIHDAPVLGQYIVNVRGPLGRGATLKVALAERLTVAASTPFRWLTQLGDGLESANITLAGEGLESPARVRLGQLERVGKLELRCGKQKLQIVGEIPYLAVGFAAREGDGEKIFPLLIDVEGLPQATIRTRVPPGSGKVYASAVFGGEVLQTLEGAGSWGSPVRTFDLSALSGTLASKPSAELRLVVDDTSAPVAFIRPRRLALSVSVDAEGVLSVEGKADIDGLVAYVYPQFARWRPPYRVEIPKGTDQVVLPEEVRREGRAVVVLVVNNPWVREVPPMRPDRSSVNAFDLKVGMLVDTDDPAERGFRRWLAGMGACPSSVESLPVALHLYSLLRLEEGPEQADRMRTALAEAVRAHRTALLGAILQSNADLEDLMRLLVEADVVTVPREEWESSDELWSLAPGLGVLADTDELRGDGEPAFRAHLENGIGAEGIAILDIGDDPALAVGRFDGSISILAKKTEAELEDLFRAAGVVPKALLDRDSRAAASKQLLIGFRRPAIKKVRDQAEILVKVCKEAIVADFGPHAVKPVEAREFQTNGGTGNLPAISLALALLARSAARAKPQSARLYEFVREGFTKLATEAPKIVHQDLALAELWITRWEDVA